MKISEPIEKSMFVEIDNILKSFMVFARDDDDCEPYDYENREALAITLECYFKRKLREINENK